MSESQDDKYDTASQAAYCITVYGRPIGTGSKKAMVVTQKDGTIVMDGRRPVVNMVDDNPLSKPWRNRVHKQAAAQYADRPLAGPLHVHAFFYFARLKGHFGTGRNADVLKKSAPEFCESGHDADKLFRSIGDALEGVMYRDDRQIVILLAIKKWCRAPEDERVEVIISQLDPDAGHVDAKPPRRKKK